MSLSPKEEIYQQKNNLIYEYKINNSNIKGKTILIPYNEKLLNFLQPNLFESKIFSKNFDKFNDCNSNSSLSTRSNSSDKISEKIPKKVIFSLKQNDNNINTNNNTFNKINNYKKINNISTYKIDNNNNNNNNNNKINNINIINSTSYDSSNNNSWISKNNETNQTSFKTKSVTPERAFKSGKFIYVIHQGHFTLSHYQRYFNKDKIKTTKSSFSLIDYESEKKRHRRNRSAIQSMSIFIDKNQAIQCSKLYFMGYNRPTIKNWNFFNKICSEEDNNFSIIDILDECNNNNNYTFKRNNNYDIENNNEEEFIEKGRLKTPKFDNSNNNNIQKFKGKNIKNEIEKIEEYTICNNLSLNYININNNNNNNNKIDNIESIPNKNNENKEDLNNNNNNLLLFDSTNQNKKPEEQNDNNTNKIIEPLNDNQLRRNSFRKKNNKFILVKRIKYFK